MKSEVTSANILSWMHSGTMNVMKLEESGYSDCKEVANKSVRFERFGN